MHRVEQSSALARSVTEVWGRAITERGINDELSPILRMTMPPGLRGKTIAEAEVGAELGRSWILLGRLIPGDYDDLRVVELEPGRRFLELSRTLAFAVWQHERVVEPAGDGGCRVTDRLGFELKRPLAALPWSARLVVSGLQHPLSRSGRNRHRPAGLTRLGTS